MDIITWNPPNDPDTAAWRRCAASTARRGGPRPGRRPFRRRGARHPHPPSGFFLYNIYFPNGQRGHDRVEYKLDFYARLLEICDELHAAGENIIITGDFNTAHQPIDLARPEENQKTSGFLPEEREWVTRFSSTVLSMPTAFLP
jgi:hypothetical protein